MALAIPAGNVGSESRDRYGLKQSLASEWTKLMTLRSTFWTLLITIAGSLAVTALSASSALHQPPGWYRGFDPTAQSLSGIATSVLAIGVLGVIAVTGEYGTGTIRTSLSSTPRRPGFFVAKAVLIGSVALAVGEVITFACFFLGQAILGSGGAPTASISHGAVLEAVSLSGVYLGLLGLFAAGLGFLLRHTAGALGAYVAATFLLSLLLNRLPHDPARFTPVVMLASSVADVYRSPGQVDPGLAVVLMALYSTIVLAAGAFTLLRRDA